MTLWRHFAATLRPRNTAILTSPYAPEPRSLSVRVSSSLLITHGSVDSIEKLELNAWTCKYVVTVKWEKRTSWTVYKPAAGKAANFCPSPGAVVETKCDHYKHWLIINTNDAVLRNLIINLLLIKLQQLFVVSNLLVFVLELYNIIVVYTKC